jgi:hypothetical protein
MKDCEARCASGDPSGDRQVVQVLSADGSRPYGSPRLTRCDPLGNAGERDGLRTDWQ